MTPDRERAARAHLDATAEEREARKARRAETWIGVAAFVVLLLAHFVARWFR